jgi:hypothetical protein
MNIEKKSKGFLCVSDSFPLGRRSWRRIPEEFFE